MALDLKLNIRATDNCNNLVIEDITRSYNNQLNPGGWGDFNISGNRSSYNMQLHLTVYHFIEKDSYATSITVPNFANSVVYPSEDTYQGFKISIPASDISSEMSLLMSEIGEDFDPMWETLEDTLYKVTVQLSNQTYSEQFDFTFNNVCLTEKALNNFIGRVNLGCEDCDDEDLEKALLAKSLFENLKNLG
tara:strand:+ start:32 stop:604 length:573 start_codon:yes stop_codon:yes gene_type:complete